MHCTALATFELFDSNVHGTRGANWGCVWAGRARVLWRFCLHLPLLALPDWGVGAAGLLLLFISVAWAGTISLAFGPQPVAAAALPHT
jgi:hypothetical protein